MNQRDGAPSTRRRVAWLVAASTVAWPASAPAQASLHLGIGARATTTLVHDSIVVPINVRAGVGPALTLGTALPLGSAWTATVSLDVAWGALARESPDAPSTSLGTVRTIAAALALHRPLGGGLRGGVGIGVLGYAGGSRGVFVRGGPSVTAFGAALLRYQPRGALSRFGLEARYDIHRFITPALRDVGFTAARPVHGLALLLTTRLAGAAP